MTSPSWSRSERRSMRASRPRSEGGPEHEQDVRGDAPGQRAAHDVRQPLVDREQRDDQLGRVPEGRVEEPADSGSGVLAGVLGRLSDQPRERDERERREHEQHDLARSDDPVEEEDDRREGERGPQEVPRHGVASLPRCLARLSSLAQRLREPQNRSMQADRAARAGQASASPAGRGRVPELRGPLRQGRVSGCLCRAKLSVPLRVRGSRPDLRRLHAEGVRRRDRPRAAAGGRGGARAVSAPSARGGGRCPCAASRSIPVTRAREDEIGCINPEFYELPAERPSFRVFAQVRR